LPFAARRHLRIDVGRKSAIVTACAAVLGVHLFVDAGAAVAARRLGVGAPGLGHDRAAAALRRRSIVDTGVDPAGVLSRLPARGRAVRLGVFGHSAAAVVNTGVSGAASASAIRGVGHELVVTDAARRRRHLERNHEKEEVAPHEEPRFDRSRLGSTDLQGHGA
jgi:hypothetical protein